MRHGQTDWNQIRRIQGSASDILLNKNGKEQAKRLAGYFKDKQIEAIYCSPLKRALATARAIAYYHKLEIKVEPDLREMDMGDLEGKTLENMTDDFSSYIIDWERGNGNKKLPNGESLQDLRGRTWLKTQEIIARHPGAAVIVNHYFVTLAVISMVLDMPLDGIKLMRVKPGSISIIDFDHGKGTLTVFNDTCHLENLV